MLKMPVDISWPLREGIPVYKGDSPFKLRQVSQIEQGDSCNVSDLSMSLHTGTHIDAPLHFISGAQSVDQLPLTTFLGLAKVVLIKTKKAVALQDLAQLELAAGDRLLLKIPYNGALINRKRFYNDYIGLELGAAELLVKKRISLVGIEYLSIENCQDGKFQVHQLLLNAGIVILEGLDLRRVEPGEYFLACQPLRISQGNGSPVRAVLW
jgi:arylformamidase